MLKWSTLLYCHAWPVCGLPSKDSDTLTDRLLIELLSMDRLDLQKVVVFTDTETSLLNQSRQNECNVNSYGRLVSSSQANLHGRQLSRKQLLGSGRLKYNTSQGGDCASPLGFGASVKADEWRLLIWFFAWRSRSCSCARLEGVLLVAGRV